MVKVCVYAIWRAERALIQNGQPVTKEKLRRKVAETFKFFGIDACFIPPQFCTKVTLSNNPALNALILIDKELAESAHDERRFLYTLPGSLKSPNKFRGQYPEDVEVQRLIQGEKKLQEFRAKDKRYGFSDQKWREEVLKMDSKNCGEVARESGGFASEKGGYVKV